jgi:type II secretory pathway component PulF
VKWLILAVVVILVAPNIAKQFDKSEQQKPTRRGLLYRAVARFGSRVVLIAFAVALVFLAVAAYYVVSYVV